MRKPYFVRGLAKSSFSVTVFYGLHDFRFIDMDKEQSERSSDFDKVAFTVEVTSLDSGVHKQSKTMKAQRVVAPESVLPERGVWTGGMQRFQRIKPFHSFEL